MAQVGNANEVDAYSAYAQSFGALRPNTVYVDKFGFKNGLGVSVDLRPQLAQVFDVQLKALASTSGGAGTAGYALSPVYVDPKIVDRSRKNCPAGQLIPRVSNMGRTADFNFITSKGGGFVAAEDATLNETNTTYDRASTAIKYLYAVGRVTGQALASIPGYSLAGVTTGTVVGDFPVQSAPNGLQMEIMVKEAELMELQENLIFNGDTDNDTNEFNGIVDLMSTTNSSKRYNCFVIRRCKHSNPVCV
jgi:hypothetical protein